MKVLFEWPEGRVTRRTEIEIPPDLSWDKTVDFIISAARKAYKYSNEPIPEGVTEGEL